MTDKREKNDLVTKNFEAFPDVAADIINALLHNGENVVTKENLMPAPTESIYEDKTKMLRNQLEMWQNMKWQMDRSEHNI